MATCTFCASKRRTFKVYLVVREAARLSGWKAMLCERCLSVWKIGEPMGAVLVASASLMPGFGGPPEAAG